ncbi:MAG: cell division protein ZapA [Eubacteriaceae bacterium]|nr:cell division protein ZapA [Eubacteriaceae bacterium]
MENNKVNVSIYGQDYTIIGGKTPEQIAKVAAHVDSRMNEIAQGIKGGPTSSLAVLSAVNIADEFFELQDRMYELERLNAQLETDGQHYVQLWEEAKKSFVTYKEDSQNEMKNLTRRKEELQSQLNEKDREVEEMMRTRQKVERDAQKGSAEAVEAVEAKYKELENNFFDLQMEDIQLKSELEKLKAKLREQDESKGY